MDEDLLDTVAGWLRESGSNVALTGAGISTESGIPDFRGPQGVWTKDPEAEKLSDISYYMGSRDIRVRAWKARLDSPVWTAIPNGGHHALAELERKGKLSLLVTQNVDGLHLGAGTSAQGLVEIHGTAREVMCMQCGERAPTERALDRVRAGEEDPPCRTCGGILKTATISFGQPLIEDDLDRAFDAATKCEVFLAVGTTLIVYPIAHMADIAIQNGAKFVLINADGTAYDANADAIIREPIGDVLKRLVEKV